MSRNQATPECKLASFHIRPRTFVCPSCDREHTVGFASVAQPLTLMNQSSFWPFAWYRLAETEWLVRAKGQQTHLLAHRRPHYGSTVLDSQTGHCESTRSTLSKPEP